MLRDLVEVAVLTVAFVGWHYYVMHKRFSNGWEDRSVDVYRGDGDF